MSRDIMNKIRSSDEADFGTVGSTVTAVEKVSGIIHITEITIPSQVLITIGGGAALAAGLLLYTLPAGNVNLINAAMHVFLTGTTAHENDTPEVALGTTIASGATATLGAVAATAEDISGPHVMGGLEDDGTEGALNLSGGKGTTANKTSGFFFADGDTATVHLNIADSWAATAGTVTAAGKVYLTWIAL